MFDDQPRPVPIAVVGLGSLMPGSTDVSGFWQSIVRGHDQMTDVPPHRWLIEDYYDPDPRAPDKTYARRGAFLAPTEFEPMAFGVLPNNLPSTDSSQLLALLVAEQVLADAFGDQLATTDRERVGVVLGATSLALLPEISLRLARPHCLKALRESGVPETEAQAIGDRIVGHNAEWGEATFPGALTNVVAGRIANHFDLHGMNHTADAACASSFAALSAAMTELTLGRADLMLTGGIDTTNNIGSFVCFSKTPALSPTGDCRPFSADADGTMLGEGIAMFALKRLADAERDGDGIYAVIRGVGASSDGSGTAIYAPVAAGQSRALRRAYREAGYGPGTVGLVEAHGTGTRAGDAAEFAALREVFDHRDGPDGQYCALGSIKSQIGHTKCAAGAAGLLKAVLALHHRVLPPTIKVERPEPALDLVHSPFYLNTRARPWVRSPDHPRRASVSSFGFGGSNFHVTVEEYVPDESGWGERASRSRTMPSELVLFAADSPVELLAIARAVDSGRPLEALARASQQAFSPAAGARLAIVARHTDDLTARIDQVAAVINRAPDAPFAAPGISYATGDAALGRVGFLFPGQGAQHVGMGADLALHLPSAQRAWDRHGTREFAGRPLHRVVFPPPAFTDAERDEQRAALTATEWAQPALAAHSLALLGITAALGLRPEAVAGHSFGELTALHAAGVLNADDLLGLARRRGELMRDAAALTPGAMMAVSATREQVRAAIGELSGVWVANHNAPEQVVLSGLAQATETAAERLTREGFTVRRLNAATAFHSPVVAAATEPVASFLRELRVNAPRIPVYGNADGHVYPDDPDEVRRRVASHLASPVLFGAGIEAMYAAGVRTFVEVGAGTTLTELVRRILGDRDHLAVGLERAGRDGVTALHEALGQLAVAGVELDYDVLWEEYAPPVERTRKEGARMTVRIDGGNFGRPYPPAGGAAALPPPNPLPDAAAPPSPPAAHQDVPAHRDVPAYQELPPARVPRSAEVPPPAAVDPPPGAVRLQPVPPPQDRSARPEPHPGLLALIEETQRQTAAAHADYQHQTAEALADYQRQVTESHLAYLRMSEASMAALLGVPVGVAPAADALPGMVADVVPDVVPGMVPGMALAPVAPPQVRVVPSLAPPPAVARVARPAEGLAPEPVPTMATMAPAPPAPPPPDQPAAPQLDAVDLEERILSIVAERTGYPAEILNLDMELEADLGIDSIKRVEILSAFGDEAGELFRENAAELARHVPSARSSRRSAPRRSPPRLFPPRPSRPRPSCPRRPCRRSPWRRRQRRTAWR